MRRSVKQIATVVLLSIVVLGSQPAAATTRINDPSDPIGKVVARIVTQIKKLFHVAPQDEPVVPHP